jgi:glucose-1-phosphate thymidylyltransferase
MPKVLLHVAGKPILAHILDDLPGLGIRRAVLVVGHMGEMVREFVDARYPDLEVAYVEQPQRQGLGHAVSLAEPHAGTGPLLIILGDTIFEADLEPVLTGGTHSIGVKEVADPRRFGIAEVGSDGRVTRLVEKPAQPTSNLALAGLYYFTAGRPLFEALAELQRRDLRTKGEFQLTDAMQILVSQGEAITTFPIEGWYDCGKTETLLDTNRVLLDKQGCAPLIERSVVHPPVCVADGAVVEECILGPHVSIASGAQLRNAVVRDSIVNEGAAVEDIMLESSVVGRNAVVRGGYRSVNVGDSSTVHFP